MATTVESYCGRWAANRPERSLLILAGDCRCGKTHTAQAIANFARLAASFVYAKGAGKTWTGGKLPSSHFIRWPEIADEFRAKNDSALPGLFDTDLLILDDVGAETDPFKIATDKLCQVLSRRERKFTVITTNVPPEKWTAAFDRRISDRLRRNSELLPLFGTKPYAQQA